MRHYKVKDGEDMMRYIGVKSPYPWAIYYFKFPVGHPTIHQECDDVEVALEREGLVLCTALPCGTCITRVCLTDAAAVCRSCAESGSREE
jgi:hypothetical protein